MSSIQDERPEMTSVVRDNKILLFVFACCFVYWGYLIRSSDMVIQFDAVSYQELGTMIYKDGWETFLKTGPHREPLYPWLVATSMRIAETMGVSYQSVQKFVQVTILFVTQLMLLALLKKAKIHDRIIAATILYCGFSPAIVNSAFSLYSEIAAYPAVLAIIWNACYSWRALHDEKLSKVMLGAVLIALAFVWAIFVKAIFQYVFLIFIVPFALITIDAIFKKNPKKILGGMAFLVITVIIVSSSVISYRYANKRFNGNFEFTNRFDRSLYGTAAQRVNKLTPALFMAHVASVPGGGVCRAFFSEEICQHCEFFGMDFHSMTELPGLLRENGIDPSGHERTEKTISLAFQKIAENPVQYFVLTAVESLKMAFWESTQVGFVAYPEPLKRLFHFSVFKNGIRFFTALLTYFSLFYLIVRVYRHRSELFVFDATEGDRTQLAFFILLMIAVFTALYAIFPILTRFALPIAALYLLCIAFTWQDLVEKKRVAAFSKG